MKGIILAGPFANACGDHSPFQESIARNLPFCDEFIAVADPSHADTAASQLEVFQDIRCRLLTQETADGSLPEAAPAVRDCPPEEILCVIPADRIVRGGDYRSAILEAKAIARQGFLAAVGVPSDEAAPEDRLRGIYLFRADVFLRELEREGSESAVFAHSALLRSVRTPVVLSGESGGAADTALPPATEASSGIIRLAPSLKEYLWGGHRLNPMFGKGVPGQMIAESWELSAHRNGPSSVISGPLSGMSFPEYLSRIGRESFGWKSLAFQEFPILIKYLDSQNSLSVQVHPDDDYALLHENEYGKNELWYILDCREDAYIYFGFNRDVTREEIAAGVADGTVTDLLNRVPVHPGDTFFIRSGTVHAVGGGITLCEIQQSSDSTYRLYDYRRRDKDGNLRELHLEKALDVLCMRRSDIPKTDSDSNDAAVRRLGSCKYFESTLYQTGGQTVIPMSEASFLSVVVLEGRGILRRGEQEISFARGDSLFVPAGTQPLRIDGECRLIATHL